MPRRQLTTDRRLGAYLALAFSLLSVALTLILVGVIGVGASDQLEAEIGNGVADLALQTADKLDRGMFERYREVRLMAERAEIVDPQATLAQRRRVLASLQETYPYYAWIGLTDRAGRVVAATGGLLEGADVSKRPWFGNALHGTFLGDVHEAVLLANLLPNPTREPKRFVDVAFPYAAPDGRAAGVLGVHLSWNWARDVERSIFEPSAAGRAIDAVIASADGKVLLGPAALRDRHLDVASAVAARSGNGFMVEKWPDQRRYLVGYARCKGYRDYPGLGWTVLVRQDLDRAYAPVTRIQRHVFWSGMLVAALFSALGLVAARRITRPLVELAQAAQRVQTGAAATFPETHASYREVMDLSEALRRLLDDLAHRRAALAELNATLEQRVVARTQELNGALEAVRANETRIQSIIATAQDAYMAVDLDGRTIEWNAAAERMLGWRRDEMLGQVLVERIIPERFRQRFADSLRELATGPVQSVRVERIVLDRDGVEIPVEATVGIVRSGERTFYSAFVHDISERRRVDRMKNEFISTVSHELRTPLTSIRASLSLLASGLAGELPEDTRKLIDISNASCERLVRLVNDVLDIEKIESGGLTLNPVLQPLGEVARQACDALAGYAGQFNVAVEVQVDAALQARFDRDAMLQVLTNLVSNAIKFSPAGGTVLLTAGAHGAGVRLAVRDLGPGIPAAFRERVFQKFAQADGSDSRKRGGTGLGLAICRSLVELMAGRIWFETAAGQGTTFYVELP